MPTRSEACVTRSRIESDSAYGGPAEIDVGMDILLDIGGGASLRPPVVGAPPLLVVSSR
jgi:hypothetical protein